MRLISLVELIVVLVILAILAAMLVPALLGWIDEAKKKQYELEARNIYMAAQAVADEGYARPKTGDTLQTVITAGVERIKTLSDLNVTSITATAAGSSGKDAFTIKGMVIEFTSANGTKVQATLNGGSTKDNSGWKIVAPYSGSGA